MSIEFHIPAFNKDKVGCKAVIALCPIESQMTQILVGSGNIIPPFCTTKSTTFNKDYAVSEPNLLMIYPEPPLIFDSRGWKRTEICRIFKKFLRFMIISGLSIQTALIFSEKAIRERAAPVTSPRAFPEPSPAFLPSTATSARHSHPNSQQHDSTCRPPPTSARAQRAQALKAAPRRPSLPPN